MLIDMIDDLRQALLETYQTEIAQYQDQKWQEQQRNEESEWHLFDDDEVNF